MAHDLFIRFKDIPPNEVSGVYDGDCGKIRDEQGVSCYEFIIDNQGIYRIVLPSLSLGVLYDLCSFIEQLERKDIPAYLISAEKVGIGTYGEPVVKNIKVLSELSIKELAEPKPEFKMDRTNKQLFPLNASV